MTTEENLIAKGWVKLGSGAWSKPKTAAQHNAEQVGQIDLATGASPEARQSEWDAHVADEPLWSGPESALHRKIMDYCDQQSASWKYIRARMDKRSTVAVGCHDITVFGQAIRYVDGNPFYAPFLLCIECKRPGGKLTQEQQVWAKEMSMIGHTVHVVRSFDEFMALVK